MNGRMSLSLTFYFECVSTVTVEYEGHVVTEALDQFLQELLWEKVLSNGKGDTIDIYRLKVNYKMTRSISTG